MANRKSLASLAEKLSPGARERAVLKGRTMSDAMELVELRRTQVMSHKQIAALVGVKQASVAKMEKRHDDVSHGRNQTVQIPSEPTSTRYQPVTLRALLARWANESPLLPDDQFPAVKSQSSRPEDIF